MLWDLLGIALYTEAYALSEFGRELYFGALLQRSCIGITSHTTNCLLKDYHPASGRGNRRNLMVPGVSKAPNTPHENPSVSLNDTDP